MPEHKIIANAHCVSTGSLPDTVLSISQALIYINRKFSQPPMRCAPPSPLMYEKTDKGQTTHPNCPGKYWSWNLNTVLLGHF